jgi:hypothetical protein
MKTKGQYTFSLLSLGGVVYLDMLEQFLIPKLGEDDQEGHIYFQQDGAPRHYLEAGREYLNTRFSGRWIGRAAPIAWPPCSPDLTPLDFVFWGFVKDRVYVPPLPANVAELRTRITAAVAEVTPEMLRRVWQEIDYRWTSAALPMEVTSNHNFFFFHRRL